MIDKIRAVLPQQWIEKVRAIPTKQLVMGGVGALLFLLLLIWFCFYRGIETTDNAYIRTNMTVLTPKVSGFVSQVLVKDNQHVNAGDLLVCIDDKDFQARLAQAEAQLETAKSHRVTLEGQKKLQLANLDVAQASIAASQAAYDKSEQELTRAHTLVADGAVSRQSFEVSTAGHKNAKALSDKSKAELQAAQSQIEIIASQLVEADAQIKSAMAAVTLAQIDLDNTKIKAPLAGTVGNLTVQIGQLARPGAAVAYLIPHHDVWVDANFKETQVGNMKIGQPVKVNVDAYGGRTFVGEVESLSPASAAEFSLLPSENATGNFTKIVRRIPVKIVFSNREDVPLFKPGMSVVVHVNTR